MVASTIRDVLPRHARVNARADFEAIRRDGRGAGSPVVAVGARLRDASSDPSARFGFVVSRRVGKATIRNRVKRRLREAARPLLASLAGWDIVATARPGAGAVPFLDLAEALASAVRRATTRRSAAVPPTAEATPGARP